MIAVCVCVCDVLKDSMQSIVWCKSEQEVI
jgi:hypothetical protein